MTREDKLYDIFISAVLEAEQNQSLCLRYHDRRLTVDEVRAMLQEGHPDMQSFVAGVFGLALRTLGLRSSSAMQVQVELLRQMSGGVG